ncbi:MAG: hypothetical protein AAB686_02375, partial [Patescibacteria group bacterium]
MRQLLKNLFVWSITATIFGILAVVVNYKAANAQTFQGPKTPVGVGTGAIGINAANNLSVGTSTPLAESKFLIVASSTGATEFALKILQPDKSPILFVRNDGSVSIASSSFGGSGLTVQGDIYFSGNLVGRVPASRVTAAVFDAGNFAFPSSLGISTSSQVGLPQPLSVYGNAYVSGNVGIGTTGPTRNLQVESSGGPIIRLFRTGFTADFELENDGTLPAIITRTASPILFKPNNAEAMRITSAGNVGIGTTTPAYKLDIQGGDVNVSGAYRKGGAAGLTVSCPSGQTLATTTVSGGIITAGNCVTFLTSAITSLNSLTGSTQTFTTSSAAGYNITSSGSTHTFFYPSKIIRIAILATTTGNILVGSNTAGWNVLAVGASGRVLMASSTAPDGVSWETVSGGGGIAGSGASGQATFWTGASTISGDNAFWWDNVSKRLGIATTSPAYTLDVNGTIRGTTLLGAYSGAIAASNVSQGVFGSSQGNGNFAFPASLGVATSSQVGLPQPLSVYGNAYVSGNVGIGTAGPSVPLHVSGSQTLYGYATTLALTETGGYPTLTFQGASNQKAMIRDQAGLLAFYVNNAAGNFVTGDLKMAINSSGNVGIGTSAPGQKLEVSGSSLVTNTMYMLDTNHSIRAVGGQGVYIDTYGVTDPFFVQQSTGNVGIGTTGPLNKFAVGAAADASDQVLIYVPQNNGPGAIQGKGDAGAWNMNLALNPDGGNVGIGTTGPEVKLHIKQTSVGTGVGDRPQSLYFGSNDNANLRGMIGWSAYGASNYFLIQAVEDAVAWRNVVLVRDGGNVGIGTAAPSDKLHIKGVLRLE